MATTKAPSSPVREPSPEEIEEQQDTAQRKAVERLLHVQIQDIDDKYAPPSRPVVRVSRVADGIFLDIGRVDDTNETETFKREAMVCISPQDLRRALIVIGVIPG